MSKLTAEQILDSVRALGPQLAQEARATDSQGLSGALLTALADTGAFRVLLPASLGGAQADDAAAMEMGRALAQHCGASAWFALSLSAASQAAAAFDEKAAADIWGKDPAALVTPAMFADGAELKQADGKLLINGHWPAVGGLAAASWVLLFGIQSPNGPVCALVPASELASESYAYFGGLRGVGWKRADARDITAPAHRIAPMAAFKGTALLLGALLGCAEGAYEDYVRATRARVSGVGGHAVAQFTQVQARLAESEAELKCCRALYDGVLTQLRAGQMLDVELERDRAYIARKAIDAVTRLLTQMGAMGLSETNPVQRRSRDLRAIASMSGLDWDAQFAAFGRKELGIADPAARSDAA